MNKWADGGYWYGMFFQSSIFDSTYLNQFIENAFSDTSLKRHMSIGIANVLNGTYSLLYNYLHFKGSFTSFGEHTSAKDMVKVLQASISYPGVF